MQSGFPCAIALEFLPNPDGDNRLDVDIREGETSVTYFSSSRAVGGARYVTVVFKNCQAVRFFVTEDHDTFCPGFKDSESDFVEIRGSAWLKTLPDHVQSYKHFVLGINHSFFECIAPEFRIEVQPDDTQG
jgi:hypothetical protein